MLKNVITFLSIVIMLEVIAFATKTHRIHDGHN